MARSATARLGLRLLTLVLVPLAVGTGAITGPSAAATTGLVAAYSFDEASGTTAKDSSGNGNAGTISNATWTTGKNGGALSFNGTTSLVTVADSPSLDLTNGMTLEAWVDPQTSQAGSASLLAKIRSGGGFPYGLDDVDGNVDAYVYTSAHNGTSSAAIPLGSWTHLAATYNGSKLSFYVNGTLAASKSMTGSIAGSADPLEIGADTVWGEYFQGKIDD